MSEKPKRWGRGRVVFIADLPAIRDEIARAIPMTEVFASRADRLGVGYSAFCKLVAKYAPDAKPSQRIAQPAAAVPPTSTAMSGPTRGRKAITEHTGIADPAELRRLIHGKD